MSDVSVAELEQTVQEVRRRCDFVVSRFGQLAERAAEITSAVAAAKGRAELGDEMQRQLEALQHRAHERSVGAFERLLSAILHDVLPGEGDVKFELSLRNSSTWLDVLLAKGDALEDALDGNGGAVANVLSTGLRYAALSRTNNRRVMVLDEPDCWVKPDRVPAFVNVISRVSEAAGFQTFLISHHDTDKFDHAVNVIELGEAANGDVVVRSQSHAVDDWADADQPGIRAIELTNVRRHKNTFLCFRPGATALVGANNLGKSTAIVSALKAVAYGESKDNLIRHGCDEAVITVYLEGDKRIVWSRKPTRSPVVLYKLLKGSEVLAEGRPGKRNEAPDWVVRELGITPVDELDVQLRNQKKPVFLLDDTASRRAQVLSIGREAGYLKMLMAEYDSLKAEDRETIRRGEAELARLNVQLQAAQPAQALPVAAKELADKLQQLKKQTVEHEGLGLVIARAVATAERLSRLASVLGAVPPVASVPTAAAPHLMAQLMATLSRHRESAKVFSLVPLQPGVPNRTDPRAVAELTKTLERHRILNQKVAKLPPLPSTPTVASADDIARIGAVLRKASQLAVLRAKIKHIEAPASASPIGIFEHVQHLTRLTAALSSLRAQSAEVDKEAKQIADEEKGLRQLLGDECPVCGSHLPEHGFKHAH